MASSMGTMHSAASAFATLLQPTKSSTVVADFISGSSGSNFLAPFPLCPTSNSKPLTKSKCCRLSVHAKTVTGARKKAPQSEFHRRRTCRLACCFKGPLLQSPLSVKRQQVREDQDNVGFGEEPGLGDGKQKWRTQAVQTEAPVDKVEERIREGRKQMDWAKAWYPAAVVEDLDPKKPKGIMVLGKRLVLWRDQDKNWRCHLDRCPHRFAPLSEGRIHESGGLQCSYHGWVFGPQGNCTLIPQADEDERKALDSKLACAVALPIKEEVGLLWVWPDERSALEALATPPRIDSTLSDPDFTYQWVYRELPYNWDTLVENVLDPAHVNFAHHKVQGKRENALPITFGVAEPEVGGFTVPGIGKMGNFPVPNINFIAPASIVYHFTIPKENVAKPWQAALVSLGTPIAPGKVAIFACFPRNFLKFAARLTPRWFDHVRTRNKVLDGDLVLLQGQELLSLQSFSGPVDDQPSTSAAPESVDSHQNGASTSHGFADRKYFMPTKSDRPIAAFRKWVKDFGNGGPRWPVGFRTEPDPLGDRPEVIMDRFTQHTQHCSACMGAYRNVQRLQSIAKVAVVASIAGAAAFSARDERLSQSLAVLAVVLTGSIGLLQRMEQQFVYVGYDHSET
ncbi:pheophorbide a oxygenase family protein [Klebsormidium nitens]|uniref:Pheophorbide a oxygenase family protein n=1 Tax=Klebsormidium nitens TaxID=105231 RepID=A0A1Y1HK84_KLENI|nr:pheophorbide a oxygenase family protein [Klebsormidium nitens]|eukprot:GAQ78985.1 pheophorbide a oxygenase family protein [Klebsormidium nitens]